MILPRESKNILYDKRCTFCDSGPTKIIDAPTLQGWWAYMCVPCYPRYARAGLGTLHKNVPGRPPR